MIYLDLGLKPYCSTHLTDNLNKRMENNMIPYLKILIAFQEDLNLLQADTYVIQEIKPLQLTFI